MKQNIKMSQAYILILFICFSISNCTNQKQKDIIVLDEFTNELYIEMVDVLGPPSDKTAYTIGNAPTKSWNHNELFSTYPKNAENKEVQILEVIWDSGEFSIFACFHMVNGVSRCLVAKRVRKGMMF